MFGSRNNVELINQLRRANADLREQLDEGARDSSALESERDDLRAQLDAMEAVPAAHFRLVAADAGTLASGLEQGHAEQLARDLFQRTGRHTAVLDPEGRNVWKSRDRGGVRRSQ